MLNFNSLILANLFSSKLMCQREELVLQYGPIVQNTSTCEIPNNLWPISYASKPLSETESNYSNIEHELLGVVFATIHFKHFKYGRPVTIISDHMPLVSLFKKSLANSSPRLSRMLLQILDYDLQIMYQEGSNMYLSDALSRLSLHKLRKTKLCQAWTLLFMKLKHPQISHLFLLAGYSKLLQQTELQILKVTSWMAFWQVPANAQK